MYKRFSLLFLMVVLMTTAVTLTAQTGGSFDLTWSTIDGGGGSSNGGAFDLSGTIGQPDAGVLTGGGFTLNGGFWQCVGTAVVSPGIGVNGFDVELSWVGGNLANIYRAENDPYFAPGTAVASGVSSVWTDSGAAGSPANNYTYILRGIDNCGESGNSQRLGEFDFAIVPGS